MLGGKREERRLKEKERGGKKERGMREERGVRDKERERLEYTKVWHYLKNQMQFSMLLFLLHETLL